jgi:hypothetical protein
MSTVSYGNWPEDLYCLNAGIYHLISITSQQGIVFQVLLVIDLIALLLTAILVFVEHIMYREKRIAKRAKIETKLKLTPEYLRQIAIMRQASKK